MLTLMKASCVFAIVSLLAFSRCSWLQKRPTVAQITQIIHQSLNQKPIQVEDEALRSGRVVRRFYEGRNFSPAWQRDGKLSDQADKLIELVQCSTNDGLTSSDFHTATLLKLQKAAKDQVTVRGSAELDLLLTDAFFTLAKYLSVGKVNPNLPDADWAIKRNIPPVEQLLANALQSASVEATLSGLAPQDPAYQQLKVGLKRLRRLPVPPQKQIAQVEVNLERWRWLPRGGPAHYVLVDIAGYRVTAYDGKKPVLTMRAVVGKDVSETPVFIDEISEIVLNPYWNIPRDIVDTEMLPKIRHHSSYLKKQDIEIIDRSSGKAQEVDPGKIDWAHANAGNFHYELRQRPGPLNALGSIEFLFPNPYSVYLHGTEAPSLFARQSRALSHGCIRIESPLALAQFIFDRTGMSDWNQARLRAELSSSVSMTIPLKKSMPVELLYWTVIADKNGELQFRPDIYGLDSAVSIALQGGAVPTHIAE